MRKGIAASIAALVIGSGIVGCGSGLDTSSEE